MTAEPVFRSPAEDSTPDPSGEPAQVRAEMMEITPDMAREWIRRHEAAVTAERTANSGKARDNRPLRVTVVEKSVGEDAGVNSRMRRPAAAAEPVETADTRPAAQVLAAEWDARLTGMGLDKTHEVKVRFIRLSELVACWGVFIEPQAVTGPAVCPCGTSHPFTPQIREAYENITRGLPDTVTVVISGRGWLVPRIYIAAHGLNAADLPELAARYGWTEGST